MRMMPERRALAVALLLAAAAASGWWLYRGEEQVFDVRDTVADEYDYSLTDFELVEMDEQGALSHTLVAENLYHYPERAQSTLAQPRLRFFEERRLAWVITAERGLVHEHDRSVQLSGDVHVRYESVRDNEDFEIFTEELQVWPDDSRAETGEPVLIVQDSGVTRSVGMRAELTVRRFDLLSEVRGEYAP